MDMDMDMDTDIEDYNDPFLISHCLTERKISKNLIVRFGGYNAPLFFFRFLRNIILSSVIPLFFFRFTEHYYIIRLQCARFYVQFLLFKKRMHFSR